MALERFDHPAWITAAATLASYGAMLVAVFFLLFVLPYLAYSQLL